VFKHNDTPGYIFSRNSEAPTVPLKKHESFLINWFLNKIGDGNRFSLDQINKEITDARNSAQFKEDCDKWCKRAEEEAEKNDFFYSRYSSEKVILIYFGIGAYYFAMGFIILKYLYNLYGNIIIILGLIQIFSIFFSKMTVYGAEQFAKWMAFKRFITDFSQIEKADIQSVAVWEHYLVYAISLGIAKAVTAKLPLLVNYKSYDGSHSTLSSGCSDYRDYLSFTGNLGNAIETADITLKTAGVSSKKQPARTRVGSSR
jgi:hypothetical protein